MLVGKPAGGGLTEAYKEMVSRMRRPWVVRERIIPSAGQGGPDHKRRVEEERILRAIQAGAPIVVLDEGGRTMTSSAFANDLGRWRDQGTRRIVFVVGGAFGLTDTVRERADLLLSFGPMTFPHQLVRLMLAEQLYRAQEILRGSAYHHGE